jgi:hypothetical protein
VEELDWFKYIFPLVGVVIGALLTLCSAVFLDNRRKKSESKMAIESFYTELNDYLDDAPGYVEDVINNYKNIKRYKIGIKPNKADAYPMSFPPHISFITMDNLLEKGFSDLTMNQRKAIKSIRSLSKEIYSRSYAVLKITDIDDMEPEEVLSIAKMCSSFFYLVSRLHHEKERFVYHKYSNQEIEQQGLDALGLKYDFQSLLNLKA